MTTIFLSGSRAITRLNDQIKGRLLNIIEKEFLVIVGDANGADKSFQVFFSQHNYQNVTVYCSGEKFRNNIGHWDIHPVIVDSKLTGRAFYTQKDKAMAQHADYGLVLWDGKSAGAISNVFEMLSQNKPVALYFSPQKKFVNLKTVQEATELLEQCEKKDIEEIAKKNSVNKLIRWVGQSQQIALSF